MSKKIITFCIATFKPATSCCKDGAPYFIDFQGGMQGPLQYDIASFLWQASARYPQTLREQLIDAYLAELQQIVPQLNSSTRSACVYNNSCYSAYYKCSGPMACVAT